MVDHIKIYIIKRPSKNVLNNALEIKLETSLSFIFPGIWGCTLPENVLVLLPMAESHQDCVWWEGGVQCRVFLHSPLCRGQAGWWGERSIYQIVNLSLPCQQSYDKYRIVSSFRWYGMVGSLRHEEKCKLLVGERGWCGRGQYTLGLLLSFSSS